MMFESEIMRFLILSIAMLGAVACSGGTNAGKTNTATPAATPLPVYGYEVVNTYPHDERAFTQGLFYHDGFLYESTGEYNSSSLRKVELATGKVLQKVDLPKDNFGEGSVLFGDKIYMITWREGIARVYGVNDLKQVGEFSYQGEGWGITTDGTSLIMSDGTHILTFLDPATFRSQKKMPVMADGKPLFLLNELEYVKGEIWANIWHSEEKETSTTQGRFPNIGKPNYIARIDPKSGNVVGWIDLAGISPDDQRGSTEKTLNGIAYDAAGDRIFVTGKNWKRLYEIKLTPPKNQ